jgi:hypothetical protein
MAEAAVPGVRPSTPAATHEETQAAIRQAEADLQRRAGRSWIVWAAVITLLLAIIATLSVLLLARPPSLVQRGYVAYMVPLGVPARSSGLEIGVDVPPPPVVVPVVPAEDVQEREDREEREDRRDRHRQPEVDREDLF